MEFGLFNALTILLILAFYLQPTLSIHAHNNLTDLNALLSFKSLITDPNRIIATNWTKNTSFCDWLGVTCNRHKRVTVLKLHDLPLQGMISPHLGNLSFLHGLFLHNLSLVGQIPETIGKLPRLRELVIQYNSLTGQIPPSIVNMSSLTILSFYQNNLSGFIPSYSNHTLPPLAYLSLSRNQFRGDNVLSNFAPCKRLEMLSLSENFFSGKLPNEIGSLPELIFLYLGGNEFSGTIPTSLSNLTKVKEIDLSSCNLTGEISNGLGGLVNLERLNLDSNSNLVGSIPITLLNNSKLTLIDLSSNKLTGHVPTKIGKSLPLLQWFNVGDNQLNGGLEFLSFFSNCKDLTRLDFGNNNLEGRIADDVGNLSLSLLYFNANDNHITGNIPSGLGNLTSLIRLDLTNNELIGNLPTSFSHLQAIQRLLLSNNGLSASIPNELGTLKQLNSLNLAYNLFSGSILESLSNISFLQYVSLKHNKLSSTIPKSLWTLVNLLHLDLSGNNLSGSLPREIGNLKALTYMDLSWNQFSGYISSALGGLLMLQNLDLSENSFSFEIPDSFGQLQSLTYLNLSHNSLSNSIPKSLANLSDLTVIDLSYNKLEGQVPAGKVFSNSTISFLFGNEALCGAPQLKPCNFNTAHTKAKRKVRLIILGTTLSVVLLILLCFLYTYYLYRKPKVLPQSVEPLFEHTRIISHHELVRATNNFSEVNLLGKGGFGVVFKGCLDDGLVVAVKVLNLDIEDVSKSFEKECQVLSMVRHRNLIKIIGVCSNMEFKAIVLEFMSKGNLEQLLYSTNCYINMDQRLNIMVDVASALEYLHHHHPHVILHCDLKPTNVLLDEEFVAHVSDFGISKLMYDESRSMITTSTPGTIGYIAPEYSCNGAVSKMSDVYSFGILLLETFTKKKPVDDLFGKESSLRDWVFKAHPNTILNVVDSELLENNVGNLHSCLVSVIELGLLCSRNSPNERIPMTEVSRRLQKIKMEYLTACELYIHEAAIKDDSLSGPLADTIVK